jgi:uncharacterized membrane protein
MRALILAPLLAFAACTPAPQAPDAPAQEPAAQDPQTNLAAMPAWENAKDAGVQFRAVGQEPGWMLDIHANARAVLLLDYGETLLGLSLPYDYNPDSQAPIAANADGRPVTLTITHTSCEDAMSGQSYPSTVNVRLDGRTLTGCGILIFYQHPHAQGEAPR